MFARFASAGLVLGLTLGMQSAAEAQFRRPQPTQPSTSRVNPVHERSKTEAEQAYQKGDYNRAIELTSSVLRAAPQDHVAFYLRASARIEKGGRERDAKLVRDGVADAREAIRYGGAEKKMYYIPYLYGMTELSVVEDRKDHAEIALKVADQTLSNTGLSDEDKAHLHYQRGRIRARLEQPAEAAADFEKAIQLDNKQLGFHIALADLYVATRQAAKAEAAFNNTVKAFPNQAVVYNNRGNFLQAHGKPSEAIVDFTRALELDPTFYTALTNRGFVLLRMGDAEAAEGDLSASIRQNANQPVAYGLRAAARLAQGRIAEAIADHQQVVRLTPNNPIAHADLGFDHFFAGDYANALTSFDKALTLDPQLRFLQPWRYLSAARKGTPAADLQKQFANLAGDAEKRDWAGKVLSFLTGETTADALLASVDSANQRLQADQKCEAHFFIAEKLSLDNNAEVAAEHYRQALESKSTHLSAYRGAKFALEKLNVAAGD